MQKLFASPKGKVAYRASESFMLHVFWEAPTAAAADELLAGLARCAAATQRDTPCTATYFFRVSTADASLCPPPARTVAEYAPLAEAARRLRVGMPRATVEAELKRRGLDPAWLDLDADAPLPPPLRDQQAVRVEFTEVYLDEAAFMEHSASRDYMDGYGVVMRPGLQLRPPRTLRWGTPTAMLIDKILDPILKATPLTLHHPPACTVWRTGTGLMDAARAPPAALLSLDVAVPAVPSRGLSRSEGSESGTPAPATPPTPSHSTSYDAPEAQADAVAWTAARMPTVLREGSCWCVVVAHPLRDATVRVMAVVPVAALTAEALAELSDTLQPVRGDVYSTPGELNQEAVQVLRAAVAHALPQVAVNAGTASGYVLHPRARELHALPAETVTV
jgi:hypothetical protein